jgi:hypothetical protein
MLIFAALSARFLTIYAMECTSPGKMETILKAFIDTFLFAWQASKRKSMKSLAQSNGN